jgi:hypothetical protein
MAAAESRASRGSIRSAASAGSEPAPQVRRTEPTESILDAINSGRNPKVTVKANERELPQAPGNITVGDAKERCYHFADQDDLAHFLPTTVMREPNCPMLIGWHLLKLVPPDWYAIVFADKQGLLRAVPDHKLMLDGYPPAVIKGGDPEHAAGFTNKKDLRLVLSANALRFYWLGLHEPFRQPSSWPTTREVMKRGYVLKEATRAALDERLASCSSDAPWLVGFRAGIRERYWPTATDGVTATCDTFLDSAAFPTAATDPAGVVRVLRRAASEYAKLPEELHARERQEGEMLRGGSTPPVLRQVTHDLGWLADILEVLPALLDWCLPDPSWALTTAWPRWVVPLANLYQHTFERLPARLPLDVVASAQLEVALSFPPDDWEVYQRPSDILSGSYRTPDVFTLGDPDEIGDGFPGYTMTYPAYLTCPNGIVYDGSSAVKDAAGRVGFTRLRRLKARPSLQDSRFEDASEEPWIEFETPRYQQEILPLRPWANDADGDEGRYFGPTGVWVLTPPIPVGECCECWYSASSEPLTREGVLSLRGRQVECTACAAGSDGTCRHYVPLDAALEDGTSPMRRAVESDDDDNDSDESGDADGDAHTAQRGWQRGLR